MWWCGDCRWCGCMGALCRCARPIVERYLTARYKSMHIDSMSAESGDIAQPLTARVQALRALGDPLRLQITDLLEVSDLSPDALAATLGISGNLLAHHLKVLEAAELVSRHRSQNDRRRTYLSLRREQLKGLLPAPRPISAARVVFVCTRNSARSVMAESVWHAMSGVPAASAGTQPADVVNPLTIAVLQQAGLDPTGSTPVGPKPSAHQPTGHSSIYTPQHIADVLHPDDLVVSVCDAVNEELGATGSERVHWSVPDPVRINSHAAFAAALAEITARVADLAPRIQRTGLAVSLK